MKLFKIVTVGVLGMSLMACNNKQTDTSKSADAKAPAQETKLVSNIDKASYGMGQNLGKNLKKQEVQINVDAFVEGINDAMAGVQKVADKDITAAVTAVRDEYMKKVQAKAAASEKKTKEFLAKNGKRPGVITTASGLQYEILKSGDKNGKSPSATDTVSVNYVGTLTDGTEFDSSIKRGVPAEFPVNGVIAGWTEALQKMKVGDKWKLYVPPELAYGARSPSPKIPPNSALEFEVELLKIENPKTKKTK
jgi:FKBP-type peptidyl-prolyl cis-trans isomerase FklB